MPGEKLTPIDEPFPDLVQPGWDQVEFPFSDEEWRGSVLEILKTACSAVRSENSNFRSLFDRLDGDQGADTLASLQWFAEYASALSQRLLGLADVLNIASLRVRSGMAGVMKPPAAVTH